MPTFRHMRAALAALLCCCATTGQAHAVAQADETRTPPSIGVRTADLDLTRTRDARILRNRIRRAASQVCKEAMSDQLWSRYGQCYRRTLKDAEQQLTSYVQDSIGSRSGAQVRDAKVRLPGQ